MLKSSGIPDVFGDVFDCFAKAGIGFHHLFGLAYSIDNCGMVSSAEFFAYGKRKEILRRMEWSHPGHIPQLGRLPGADKRRQGRGVQVVRLPGGGRACVRFVSLFLYEEKG